MPELKKAPAGMTARNTSNRIFNLVKRNPQGGYPATADIPEEDEVYMEWTDKKSGEEKSGLRHIRFAIGESSIYVDEQSAKAETRRGKIKFTDGLLTVNEMEKTKIEFLEVCNYNKSNHESGTAMVGKSALFRSDASKHEARLRLNKRHQKQKLNISLISCLTVTISAKNSNLSELLGTERILRFPPISKYHSLSALSKEIILSLKA